LLYAVTDALRHRISNIVLSKGRLEFLQKLLKVFSGELGL